MRLYFNTWFEAMDAASKLHSMCRRYGGISKEDAYKLFYEEYKCPLLFNPTTRGWKNLDRLKVRRKWSLINDQYVMSFPRSIRIFPSKGGCYMSVDQMRTEIAKVYPGDKWKTKVKKMSDNQVMAIYGRFLDQKKLVG